MRLMVIGHSFLQAIAQRKYVAMKRRLPSLKVRILTTDKMPHLFKTFTFERNADLAEDEALPLTPVGRYVSNMTYILPARQLYCNIRDFKPDIIHMEEEPHALVTTETFFLARAAAPRAMMSAFVWDNLFRVRRWPLNSVKVGLDRYALGRCGLVVCGNQDARAILHSRRQYRGTSVVLPQSDVDPSVFAPETDDAMRRRLGVHGTLCIGYIGRMVPEKGVELLLEALSSLTKLRWKLLLVGSGPLTDSIRTVWQERLPGRIVHVPAVPAEEIERYHRSVDIFVLPSYATDRWKEQFGLTLAQAMMAARACIGSSSGAIPEILGPAGLVFTEKDTSSLADALTTLLTDDRRRRELGVQARDFAMKNYSSDALADRYLTAFQAARQ